MPLWLNDPWVIGIGGGILSGLIVTYISGAILSKRDNKEYRQKVATANQEILYAIRPCISEGTLPNRKVMLRVTSATARKYEVDRKDLLTILQIIQSLTKEVMDSSFISVKSKIEYCNLLSQMVDLPKSTGQSGQWGLEIDAKRREVRDYTEYRSKMISMVSILAGIMTALMTVMTVMLQQSKYERLLYLSNFSELISIVLPALVSLVTIVIASFAYVLLRDRRKNDFTKVVNKASNALKPKEEINEDDKP